MSNPFSLEGMARIRDDARRLLRSSVDHADHLHGILRAAERDLQDAKSVVSLARVEVSRACLTAREQLVAARRLLRHLDEASGVSNGARTSRHTHTVLVVDDFEDVRELNALVLRRAGFIVRTAVNGLEGLIAAYDMQPGVIVMDVAMPVLDGIEATRLIKATEETRHAKVIAFTGNPASLASDHLFAAVITKPATPDVMLAAVQLAAAS